MLTPVKFNNPPVVEVACGVMFHSLSQLKAVSIGIFWQRLRDRFPRIEETAPINPVFEAMANVAPQPQIQLQLLTVPPMRRVWLMNGNGSHLIQIQQDRFLFNWKRVHEDEKYPSYDVVIKQFDSYLAEYIKFLNDEQIGSLVYRQFELSYINIIGNKNGLNAAGMTGVLCDHIREKSPARFLPEPESFTWNTSYLLPEESGRLHVNAQAALRRENQEKIIRLELTARGIPANPTEDSRRPWFNVAHDWITHGFADSTSKALHDTVWERTA